MMRNLCLLLALSHLFTARASLETVGINQDFLAEVTTEYPAGAHEISVACVGDSITAGGCSSGPDATYPSQLQHIFDRDFPGKYRVQNLGASGATLLKSGDSPFWKRAEYSKLVSNRWDIIVIMLGTNDAKDRGDHGPGNWQHNCNGPNALQCEYAQDYAELIRLSRTLGKGGKIPDIYVMIPPPLTQHGAYGMNQTVINSIFPVLIPKIAQHNGIEADKVIDVFSALGGSHNWKSDIPAAGCTLQSKGLCKNYCCKRCDQCHPCDTGYLRMAETVAKSLTMK